MSEKQPAVAIIPLSSFDPVSGRLFTELGDAIKAVRKGELELPVGSYLAVRLLRPVEISPPPEAKSNVVRVGGGFITRAKKGEGEGGGS